MLCIVDQVLLPLIPLMLFMVAPLLVMVFTVQHVLHMIRLSAAPLFAAQRTA
jgi:hypothetical protein